MPFNSLTFALFLILVFSLYWLRRDRRWQNTIVLVASYVFYSYWDWRFSLLILASTLVDYLVGLKLNTEKRDGIRKWWLGLSLAVNLGALAFFKYAHFFIDSFMDMAQSMGFSPNPLSLQIILPVGISFYTFQTLSYTIDVYRGRVQPTRDFVAFASFVSFFPQLVAGPIEKAQNLLPQFYKPRVFEAKEAAEGMRQILWGLFKKIVIADNCAFYANMIFDDPTAYSGSTLVLGLVFFSFQIYGDFSGYSDIAIGTGKLFGIHLRQNFAFPFFSRDIAEFWRRWHISLTAWFKSYVYIPLGGSKGALNKQLRNVFIVFLLSGLWHGANWTFLAWGAFNALLFVPLLLRKKNRSHMEIVALGRAWPSLKQFLQMLGTFALVSLSWIFFRAECMADSLIYLKGMLSLSLFSLPKHPWMMDALWVWAMVLLMLIVEWRGRNKPFALHSLSISLGKVPRYSFYLLLIVLLFWFSGDPQAFIYFQF